MAFPTKPVLCSNAQGDDATFVQADDRSAKKSSRGSDCRGCSDDGTSRRQSDAAVVDVCGEPSNHHNAQKVVSFCVSTRIAINAQSCRFVYVKYGYSSNDIVWSTGRREALV